MKIFLMTFLFFSVSTIKAQKKGLSPIDSIKNTINTFFEGMHKKDTALIRTTLTKTITMHTIQKMKGGNSKIIVEPIDSFLMQIVTLPLTIKKIEEKIVFDKILVDDVMAMAWTPFELYFNDTFYSCGVNHFQLVKIDGIWKINFIIDTRRKICAKN